MSITAGQGHNNTAKAIEAALHERGVECSVLDTYKYLNKLLGNTVSKGYLLSVENARAAYARAYRHFEKRQKTVDDNSVMRVANSMFCRKMKKYIDEYAPDVIVSTHVFPLIILDIMRMKYGLDQKIIGILTDFTFHPYWEEVPHTDYVVIPNELFEWQAAQKGIKKEQLLPFGIPINPKFNKEIDSLGAKRELGLDENKVTVLLMSGSMGYGKLSDTVKKLDDTDAELQMLVVCGNNSDEKEKIERLELKKKVLCFGYVDNVELLMSAADCIVTKPGGLTISEALAKRIPIIISNPIPGQEERNTEFLLNQGAAFKTSDTCTIEELLYQIAQNPSRLDMMRSAIDVIRKPDSTERLCDFIVGGCVKPE